MAQGNLDRHVQFLRARIVDDGFTDGEVFDLHGAPVRAARRDVSDGEKLRAGELMAEIMARFTIRSSDFSREITAKDRLQSGGLTWDIVGMKQLDRGRWLEITAEARADG